ncbi:MAG TPA: hypothetical protein VGM56_03570, partial [Byssovorax sp.]
GLFALPSRLGGGYVFWSDARTFVAPSFDGPLTAVAEIAATGGAAPLRDRVILRTPAGALELDPRTRAVRRAEEPGLTAAAASTDGDVSVTLDALGRARVRLGAPAPIDLTSRTGERFTSVIAGAEVKLTGERGEMFFVGADGALGRVDAARTLDLLRPEQPSRPREAELASRDFADAVTRGVEIAPGVALVTRDGSIARVSLRSGQTIDEHPTRAALDSTCALLRLADELVAVCPGGARASVFSHVDGEPELEIAFDARASFVLGAGAALGFEGPCDRASADGTSPPRAPRRDGAAHVYCARQPGGAWIERAITGADGEHFLRWIPAAGGRVTALVAAHDGPPTSDAGVRKIRVTPPDLSLAASVARTIGVDRDAWEEPGGAVRVWPRAADGRRASVRVDAGGVVHRLRAPPEGTDLTVGGRRAIAWSRAPDAPFFESTDGGETFHDIDPPPARVFDPPMPTDACSDLGCAFGGWARVGWGSSAHASPVVDAPMADPPRAAFADAFPSQVSVTCTFGGAKRPRRPASPHGAPVPVYMGHTMQSAPMSGPFAFDVAAPFAPEAPVRAVTFALDGAHGATWTAPFLDRDGVDLLFVWPTVAARAGAPSVRMAEPTHVSSALDLGAGATLLFDEDYAILRVARGAASAVATRLTRAAVVAPLRLTLARRLDRAGVTILGYRNISGEVWVADLDLGRGEAGPLVSVGRFDGATACTGPRALLAVVDLPTSILIDDALDGGHATTDVLASYRAFVTPAGVCLDAMEARGRDGEIAARLDARGVAVWRRPGFDLTGTCRLARGP